MITPRKLFSLALAILLLVALPSIAVDLANVDPKDLFCRVVDVGAGECCVIRIPGKSANDFHYIVYDAGNFEDKGASALEAIKEIIPANERIDLLVLSHTDSDHTASTPDIVDNYFIDRILRTGAKRFGNFPATLRNARKGITRAVQQDGTLDLNLNEIEFPVGATYRFGDALVTMVCGFGEIPDDFGVSGNSEKNNCTSIVIRISFHGQSILFCGDAVGRHKTDTNVNALIATEKFMVENKDVIIIDSDIIVAPHHGANNGSSTAFVKAVSPKFVIFSAGSKHGHPTTSAAERYLNNNVFKVNMFRTDRGDKIRAGEWDHLSEANGSDGKGDDDVDIVLHADGSDPLVEYRQP